MLDRALRRARWSILWERVWPPLAALLVVGGLFLALSWLGLWLWLPPIGRAIGVVLFAARWRSRQFLLSLSFACRRGPTACAVSISAAACGIVRRPP